MTSPTRPASQPADLALRVAHELPYDDRYQFPRGPLAEHVTRSYLAGGLIPAAERAYLAGYRVGERAGQLAASRAAIRVLDGQWYREPDGTKRAWLADCVRQAQEWESNSSQRFYLSYNPHVGASTGRRPLRNAGLRDPDEALPEVAAAAFTLGLDAGRSNAESLTREGVLMYARTRGTELGLGSQVVTTALAPLSTRPPRSPLGPSDPAHRHDTRNPSALAQQSFAAPAQADAARPPATENTSAIPARQPNPRRRSR